jgi:hypothetical protein
VLADESLVSRYRSARVSGASTFSKPNKRPKMTTVDIQSVIAKVVKLRALSTSSNEHEARNAARLAEKLIQEHRLSEAQLEVEGAAPKEPVIQAPSFDVVGDRWRINLLLMLTRHYDCIAVWSTIRKTRRVNLIGRASDIATIRYQLAFFEQEISRLTALHLKARGSWAGNGRAVGNAFRVGMVYGIREVLRESKEAVTASVASNAVAMVLVGRADEAKAECDRLYPKLHNVDLTPAVSSYDSYKSGQQAGRDTARKEGRQRLDSAGSRALPSARGAS